MGQCNYQINIKPGVYRHYKDNKYKLICCARHTETKEELVIYQALYGEQLIWARPKDMFIEEVEIDGRMVPRFEFIDE